MRAELRYGGSGSVVMQYLIYIAVAAPLVLGWLFWETAGVPEPPPMFHSFADRAHDEAVLERKAKETLRREQAEKLQRQAAKPRQPDAGQAYARTARATPDRDIRLR